MPSPTDEQALLLRRIAALPYEAEYDAGVGSKAFTRLIQVSHDGVLPGDVQPLALRGWVTWTERSERFAQSPRKVRVANVTALGRHAAGLVPPPRPVKHRRPREQEEA